MVGVAVFLGLAGYAAVANRNKVNVTNLKAGQCFNLGVNQPFTDVITIPCSTPHDVEVAARVADVVLVSYPVYSTAYPTAGSIPGPIPGFTPDSSAGFGSSISEAKRRCADEIVKYVGGPLDPNLYTPRIITLKSAGLRGDAWCIVRANDFGKLYKSVSGTVH